MDPRTNPYAPGAGTPPPELAGRGELIERAAVALHRIRNGLSAKSLMLVGLRGVGKTVLLNRMRDDADAEGILTVTVEASEKKSLPALLGPPLRAALLRLDRVKHAGDLAKRALTALSGLLHAAKAKYGDVEVSVDLNSQAGLADSGDFDEDLIALFDAIGKAAREKKTALALFIDELQYVEETQLASLIAALHRCAQSKLPLTLIGAGLPQLVGHTERAKSSAERLFEFTAVGPLKASDAADALTKPAKHLGVKFDKTALDRIISETQAYPYFLQEWGKHSWNVAKRTTISKDDVSEASRRALNDLDSSFFLVRFERLTPSEKRYLKAMADLGPGPHRSGDIATQLDVKVSSVAPVRAALIEKGMIYSPSHGDTGFTVPLFDGFMKRSIGT